MRAPASPWTVAIDSLSERAVILTEIQKAGSVVHRFAFHDEDVSWNSLTWTAASGTFSQVLPVTGVPEARLRYDNVDKAWNTRFGTRDYHKSKVVAYVVDLDALGSVNNAIKDYWWIQRWGSDKQWVTFSLSLQVGLLVKRLPGRTYADYCPWAFKGTKCGYIGAHSECSKQLEGKHGCRYHFGETATKRHGGFPNRPARLVVGAR